MTAEEAREYMRTKSVNYINYVIEKINNRILTNCRLNIDHIYVDGDFMSQTIKDYYTDNGFIITFIEPNATYKISWEETEDE